MCGMTEHGVRAREKLPTDTVGRYEVARGNRTGVEMYLTGRKIGENFRVLYAIRVKPKQRPSGKSHFQQGGWDGFGKAFRRGDQ